MPKLKHEIHITTVEFYNYYADTYFREKKNNRITKIFTGSKYYMSKSEYTKILESFNSKVLDSILNEPLDYVLPGRLGILCIRKQKPELRIDEQGNFINRMPINWKETRKLWNENPEAKLNKKMIRFVNEHSNQYVGKFVWRSKQCNFNNKSAYVFVPCRTAKLKLAEIFKDENRVVDYFLKER